MSQESGSGSVIPALSEAPQRFSSGLSSCAVYLDSVHYSGSVHQM